MKRSVFTILVIVVLISALFTPKAASADSPVRYVVVFQSNSIPKNAAQTISTAGGQLVRTLPQIGVGIAVSSDPNFAGKLQKANNIYAVGSEKFMTLPDVVAVNAEPEDGPTSRDTYYYAYQWDIRRVKADLAWNVTSGSHNTVVAVIDTGVAWNHPDLSPNMVYAACYSIYPNCNPYPSLHWHGTHVAGTIAAAFGGGRAVGVGPNLGIASYNVFDLSPEGDVVAYDEAIWAAMLDAADKGFEVINMSLGGYIIFPLKEAGVWTAWNRVATYVTKKGVTIVSAAGNETVNLNGPIAHIPSDLPDVISVGATGIRPDPFYPQDGAYDVLTDYSNYGAAVTLVAPGGDLGPDAPIYPYWWYMVFSTYVYMDPTCAATYNCPLGYAWAGGTSMASPHVAGAAGLVKDVHPGYLPYQVRATLKQTAEALGDRQLFGAGMLNVFAAVTK